MSPNNDFEFHAFATGFAGQITHPFQETIESQAPSALSPQGGYSSSRVENYRFREILSFQAAYTQTAGAFNAETGSWDTIMTSTVEGLNILGVVKADRIVARLASRHSIDDTTEPVIIPVGSVIDGLQIAGFDVGVALHTDLYSRLGTYSQVVKEYRDDADFRKTFDEFHRVDDPTLLPASVRRHFPWSGRKAGPEMPQAGQRLFTSLVEKVTLKSSFLSTYGHVVVVPQFGTVILGQLLLDGRARRLNMVKVELGCAVNGYCSAGTGETNGQPMPPPPPEPKSK